MPRSFSSKDAKRLKEEHQELLRQLKIGRKRPEEYREKIRSLADVLLRNGTFSDYARRDFLSGNADVPSDLKRLVRLLYIYRGATPYADRCRQLLSVNEDRIQLALHALSRSSGGISWFFSSARQKEDAENAYALLQAAEQDSYMGAADVALMKISDVEDVAEDSAWSAFEQEKGIYKSIFTEIVPDCEAGKGVPEIDNLVARYGEVRRKYDSISDGTDQYRKQIRRAAEKLVMRAVLDVLKTVPLEELGRGRKNIRYKALYDAGYSNTADIYAASPYQLASVYGVSEDAAYTIKSIAQEFAEKTRSNTKIRLSTDNKSADATRLVSAVYAYRRRRELTSQAENLENRYGGDVRSALADLNRVKNGCPWLFFPEARKNVILRAYRFLQDQLTGEYVNLAESLARRAQTGISVSSEQCWDDFSAHSIEYFNILEEVVPGILGNDDRLYGLPEDLAREVQEECFFPDGLNCELRRYQVWGVKYILHQERVLLGDEMGLGKTVQAIAAMVSLRNTGATHFIVVCPASVLPNWCKEITAKSKLRVTKVHGAGRSIALKSWIRTGGVAVTTYETTGIFQFDTEFRFDMLVVDEAHFIKNEKARRSANVRILCLHTDRLLFMTGTALENKVDEMISLIDVLQPAIADRAREIAYMSTAPQFRERVAPVYYRRKRETVLSELPELIESSEWCALSPRERARYENDVLMKNQAAIRRVSWTMDDLNDSCKACRLREIVEAAAEDGRKVLVFSFFLDTIRKVHDFLGPRCLNPINGSLPPQRRQEIIGEFNEAPAGTVLCAQIQSGGTGLNIQSASVVIICEPQLKPSIENQAISRAYRMGQARNVLVYRLLCENTTDERIMQMLEQKQAQFDAFADISVAAEKTEKATAEVDEKTFAKIIEEEIERINKSSRIHENDGKPSEAEVEE